MAAVSAKKKEPAARPVSPDMTVEEMKEILKSIARDGANQAARIAAVKELRSIQAGEAPSSGFGDLDELAPRRRAGG